jgi:hypothetical protein
VLQADAAGRVVITDLAAAVVSSSQINLTWTDEYSDETAYKVERATATGGPYTEIASLAAASTSYANTGLSAATTYYYRIRAISAAGTGGYSTIASATTTGVVPSAPTNLVATAFSSMQINLTWTDTSSNETGFKVETATAGSGGPFTLFTTTAAQATSASVSSLTASTQYWFRVGATNGIGTTYSAVATATTQPAGTSGVTFSRKFGGADAGLDYVFPKAVAIASTGNIVVGGNVQGTADFGGGNTAKTSSLDLFIATYTGNGVFSWARRVGSTALSSEIYALALDSADNIYAAGNFNNTLNVGTGNLVSAGGPDILLVKYNAAGTVQWSKRIGGTGTDKGFGIAVDANGDIYVTGVFVNSVDFGSGTPLTSAGGADIFLAKYSAAGTHLWSKRFGGTGSDIGYAVALDSGGNVLLTGKFQGTADFGGGALTSAGDDDIVVAKYDPTGAHLWSKRFGGTSADTPIAMAIDSADNILVTGGFYSPILNFGGQDLVNSATTGTFPIFLVKLSTAGAHVWSKMFTTGSSLAAVVSTSVAVDTADNVLLTGQIGGTVNFGGGNLLQTYNYDVFVAKFDSAGTHQWSYRPKGDSNGGPGHDKGTAIAADADRNVIVAGEFVKSENFAPVGGQLSSTAARDGFLVRYTEFGGS